MKLCAHADLKGWPEICGIKPYKPHLFVANLQLQDMAPTAGAPHLAKPGRLEDGNDTPEAVARRRRIDGRRLHNGGASLPDRPQQ